MFPSHWKRQSIGREKSLISLYLTFCDLWEKKKKQDGFYCSFFSYKLKQWDHTVSWTKSWEVCDSAFYPSPDALKYRRSFCYKISRMVNLQIAAFLKSLEFLVTWGKTHRIRCQFYTFNLQTHIFFHSKTAESKLESMLVCFFF